MRIFSMPIILQNFFGNVYPRDTLRIRRKSDEIKAAYDTCISEFGGFNTLLNIVCYGRAGNLETMSYEDWNSMFDGCIGYVFRATQAAIPYLKKNENTIS